MSVFIFSHIRPVGRQILAALGPDPVNTLIIDSAMPERNRGGGTLKLLVGGGHTVSVCDPTYHTLPDLSAFGSVHLTGGNPFRLLKAARGCGLQARLEERLADPDFTLIAGSAGAMVLGTDITHARTLCRDLGVQDDAGFGWLDGCVMPHIDKAGSQYDVLRTLVDAQSHKRWITVREADFLSVSPALSHTPMMG